ncbi:MAG: hypothetical protein IKR98_00555 [Bacteroidaceae bacterium]|nr:hypothetical protein [Bacteroidaceae bacterium]
MKHLVYIPILLVMAIFSLSSCSSKQTLIVQGQPGTVISSPQQQQLAIIDYDGKAKVTLKRSEGYTPFLLSQAPGSNLLVPFAVDYKNRSTAIAKAAFWTGTTAALIGAIVGISGAAMTSSKYSKDTGTNVALGGLGVMVAGTGVMLGCLPAVSAPQDFKYLTDQQTNNDLLK